MVDELADPEVAGVAMDYEESEFVDLVPAPQQQELLRKILRLAENTHEPPSVSEMTAAMGLSADSNTVRLLDGLEEKGYIERHRINSRVQPRGTSLTGRGLKWLGLQGVDTSSYSIRPFVDDQVRRVPLHSPLAAGEPRSVDERTVEYVLLPAQNIPIGKVYMLGVKGDSMMGEDGILDGDQIIVVPYSDPRGGGEMVVATVDGAETVKRLWRFGDHWRLRPSNPDYREIKSEESDEFLVTGRVVGVVRWRIKLGRRSQD